MTSPVSSELLFGQDDGAHAAQPALNANEFKQLLSEINGSLHRLTELAGESKEPANAPESSTRLSFAQWLQQEYSQRRKRDKFFPAETLLGEPGWDLLLDLAIQKCANRQISVTSACIAAQVPTTTALRWITILEHLGLVERTVDHGDKRRSLVSISDSGLGKMRSYFDAICTH
ncbi:MarR family transcriptional regulator [Novosphingobium sp. B 225]|uniref:MarR family transcriptional regulator n=1 Tax=Novosphingobium sp. B 225 TaxID=1961849 RepID=UPI00112510FF|nr:MarR family transcriptional regulator [Novosphingobium sp. B 225]